MASSAGTGLIDDQHRMGVSGIDGGTDLDEVRRLPGVGGVARVRLHASRRQSRSASPAGPTDRAVEECRRDSGLTAGTVMERVPYVAGRMVAGHPRARLGGLFWSASQMPGIILPHSSSARSGFPVTKPPFRILHKLRAGMVRPDQDRFGSEACDHVEVDETWVGGRTRGKGRGVQQASCRQRR